MAHHSFGVGVKGLGLRVQETVSDDCTNMTLKAVSQKLGPRETPDG